MPHKPTSGTQLLNPSPLGLNHTGFFPEFMKTMDFNLDLAGLSKIR